jgi:ATP-dependent Clp protease protease subunit
MGDLSERTVAELVDAVRQVLRKEASARLRDVYLIGDIEKDTARACIERMRELASDSGRPITFYINSAGGNVTDGLAIHDSIRHIVSLGIEVAVIVQGMAYSMGSIVLQAASPGRRLAFPHSWIMIHEPAKWAGWQSTTAAAQHLERLKEMQDQIYNILSARSHKPLRQIIKDTKRTDFYLDAKKALEYGLIDAILTGQLSVPKPESVEAADASERHEAVHRNGGGSPGAEAPPSTLAMRETGEAGEAGGTGKAGTER